MCTSYTFDKKSTRQPQYFKIVWGWWWWFSWAGYFNVIPSLYPKRPVWEHPAWGLAAELPEDAVPLVSKKTSIVASNRLLSYTFDESLFEKEPRNGLKIATHMIVDQRREKVMELSLIHI